MFDSLYRFEFFLVFVSRDPAGESITALSVYLTPKTSVTGNWYERNSF